MANTTQRHIYSDTRRLCAMGLLVTLGIVFGDIGTSPLYVMKAITHVNPEYDAAYITGAVSCIIWTLTLQTTVKYVLIALRADNKGEGGILALYSLLRRSPRKWLYIIAAIGASALIADGVITPAVTVTSAIEGLRGIDPDTPVVPITLIIIAGIFLVQRTGTHAIGRWFGPFMLLWFLMLGALGCMNVGNYISIFKAFNPWYAVNMLIHYPGWFLVLGAVFLCTTGAEALYSDLGHCGRLNITVSWLFVKVMLILNYLGQGAWLIANPEAGISDVNPFFATMPRGMLLVGILMSTGAAIIASQALISGSFTIFSEAISLNFWPRLRIKYPTTVKGQLYIPVINLALCIGCIGTVLMFRTSSHMEAAYGLAITITMLMTTVLLTFYLRMKGVPAWIVATFATVFIAIESIFFTANMFKFMHGGWFTILLAGVVFSIMYVWYRAYVIRSRFIDYRRIDGALGIITDIKNDREIPKYASNVVYFSHSPEPDTVESKLLYSIINKQPKRADHYWIIRLDYADEPDTLAYRCRQLIPGTLLSIDLHIGFRVKPQVSVYLRQIVEDLVADGAIDLTSSYPSLHKHHIAGDFRFVVIHRIFSPSSTCKGAAAMIMTIREWLRRIGISDEKALGLDTSNVSVENVPLILNTAPPRRITRI